MEKEDEKEKKYRDTRECVIREKETNIGNTICLKREKHKGEKYYR